MELRKEGQRPAIFAYLGGIDIQDSQMG